MTMLTFGKGRGIGDCGDISAWVWDGTAFRLTRYDLMPDCKASLPTTGRPSIALQSDSASQSRRREHQNSGGGYPGRAWRCWGLAASGSSSTSISGYHCLKTEPSSRLRVLTRVCYGFEQLFELWVCFFEVVDQGLEVIDLGERFVEIAMSQRPFTPPASAGGELGGTARGGRTRPVEKAVCISYTLPARLSLNGDVYACL